MSTERQKQIIEIAMKLTVVKGIQGFTIKNLSKGIGISEPAIYRHFENKTARLIAILNGFKEMVGLMSSPQSDANVTVNQKIEQVFMRLLSVFTEQPIIISVFSAEIFKNDIVLRNIIIEIDPIQQTRIEDIITEYQHSGNVRTDIETATFVLNFVGAFRLLVKRWDLNNQNFDFQKEGESLINSFKLFIK